MNERGRTLARPGSLFALCTNSKMAELHVIAEELRRHRQDLDDQFDTTSTRSAETAGLLAKIEELRRRAEETQRRYDERLTAPRKNR